jgi:arsenate reductase
MSEAFLRYYAGDRFEAISAGLEPKGINRFTERVMDEIGVSLDGQSSKDVQQYLGKMHSGYLITVCGYAEKNCPTAFLGISHREHWSLEDSVKFQGREEETLEKFREVRDQIGARIQAWLIENQEMDVSGSKRLA